MAESTLTMRLGRQATLARHRLEAALGSGVLWVRLIQVVLEVGLVFWGLWPVDPSRATLFGLGVLALRIGPKIWKGSAPATMKELEGTSKKRAFAITDIVLKMSRFPGMSVAEIKSFQHEVLCQVVSYVRDLRGDGSGRKIFANLLIGRGDSMVVTGRSDDRPLWVEFPKADSIAWRAITSGELAFCGDLYAECPNFPEGKKYNSILALPVIDHHGTILGVVTLDSREKHHFDAIVDDVVMHVAPLIAMLGWTLAREQMFDTQMKEKP